MIRKKGGIGERDKEGEKGGGEEYGVWIRKKGRKGGRDKAGEKREKL